MEHFKYDTICLSGGGTKGMSFIGALDYLIANNFIDLQKINNWVGTSIGAVISFMITIGYTPEDIGNFFINFNFEKLEPDICVNELLINYGIDTGDKVMFILTHFLKLKLNINDITFSKHYELTNKKLTVISTNFTKGVEAVFNYELTPDLSILLAIRMTISVPLFFTPVLYNSEYYIDGAIINNFPICHCNPKKTLGLYIKNTSTNELNSIFSMITGCMGIICDTITNKDCSLNNYDVIEILNSNFGFMNLKLDLEKKYKIINLGQNSARFYIDNLPYTICKKLVNELIDQIIATH